MSEDKNNLRDFNNINHRTYSATARFQKGLYHLFMLRKSGTGDVFGKILRMYQCLFDLCSTQLLLDSDFKLKKEKRLKRYCKDPGQPTRDKIDPAAILNHSTFGNNWKGFKAEHYLFDVSQRTLRLHNRVVETRHNLIYRPFMLADLFWEDCTLMDLLGNCPSDEEIEDVYRSFFQSILEWHRREKKPNIKRFIEYLFLVYDDQRKKRPTETLLSYYIRLLNPDDEIMLQEVKKYRNDLLNVNELTKVPNLTFLKSWKIGDL